jgi:dipeptidyl aminopeptidase/acylaminoacyl peptidase
MNLLSHVAVKWLLIGVVVVILLSGLLAVRVMLRSYRGEREDFMRSPSALISGHPERTGIRNLVEVAFPGPDEQKLAAWYAASENGAAVVLSHGTAADRSSLLEEIRVLADAGFGVLALDLPGQGASEGKTSWGVPEQRAISAAVTWLTLRPEVSPSRIGGFGFSMGAYVLAQAAVADARLRAVVLAASPSEIVLQTRLANSQWGWFSQLPALLALRNSGMTTAGNQPVAIIGSISPRSVLVLGGDLDDVVPESMTRALYASAKSPKELWIIHGAHHGDYSVVAPVDYPRRLINFFTQTLLTPK